MMLNKKFKVVLVAALISGLTLSSLAAAFSSTPLAKKQEIDALERQIKDASGQIEQIEDELVSLRGRLAGVKQEIKKSEEKLKKIQSEIEYRESLLNERIKQLYYQGKEYGLLLLLDSDSFWDLINRVRFLTFLSRAEAENIRELKEARKKEKEYRFILEQNRQKLEIYTMNFSQRLAQLNQLRQELERKLKIAKAEYNLMITPSGLRKYASRGYIRRGGGYQPHEEVPKKFVSVLPYEMQFLTSARMPDRYQASGKKWVCYASWYGNEFHGRRTASGEIFNQWDFTVAHRTLPFGTFVLIKRGNRAIVAKVTDRGPFIPGREFDLSKACAQALGFSGVAKIEVEIIFPD